MDSDSERELRHYDNKNSPQAQQQNSEWSEITEKEAKDELLMYRQFLRAKVHILQKDSASVLQLALNCPDSSVIYKEACKIFHFLTSLFLITLF